MNPGHYTYVDPSATPLVYTDDYAALSKDKPAGHAHIINTAGFNETSEDQYKLRAADGIATYLFKIEPAALTALLDLDQPSFVFHEKKTKTFSGCHVFVFREDRKITVSLPSQHPPSSNWRSLLTGTNPRPATRPRTLRSGISESATISPNPASGSLSSAIAGSWAAVTRTVRSRWRAIISP